ncbi:MAG: hypothetical protein PHE83_17115, partial [Opitutaceae bacterium]|nr:hypothetical protein [Opitutaceae bacterium]
GEDPKWIGVNGGVGESGGEATAFPHLWTGLRWDGLRGLDKRGGWSMKGSMAFHRPGRNGAAKKALRVLKHELAALQKRSTKLWGELGALEQEYVERKLIGAPTTTAFRQYESLWERYRAYETRRVQVRGMIAERMESGDDLL